MARSWWDGFKFIQVDRVITWADFKQGFCTAHIPSGIMAINKREFQVLKEGSDSVKEYLQKFNLLSMYAPEDYNIEVAKIEHFMKGLQQALEYQHIISECQTFF
ncbi:hypothetical protein D1007_29021 [Hordeum vulgare]|nr:hypothetical protein D1007_29021 [Hordeum vulgare]